MATDYDAPRRREEDEMESDSLEGLKAAESNKTIWTTMERSSSLLNCLRLILAVKNSMSP